MAEEKKLERAEEKLNTADVPTIEAAQGSDKAEAPAETKTEKPVTAKDEAPAEAKPPKIMQKISIISTPLR